MSNTKPKPIEWDVLKMTLAELEQDLNALSEEYARVVATMNIYIEEQRRRGALKKVV